MGWGAPPVCSEVKIGEVIGKDVTHHALGVDEGCGKPGLFGLQRTTPTYVTCPYFLHTGHQRLDVGMKKIGVEYVESPDVPGGLSLFGG